MELSARKDTVRRLVLSRRGRLTEEERLTRARAIEERLLNDPIIAGAETVLAFVPYRSEPPIHDFLQQILARSKRLLVPYVADDGALRATEIGSLDELEPGYRGIPEPRARMPVDPATAGVVIVPGVAFDDGGNRLGYGGGFYDAFLGACHDVPRIGVCFDLQVVDEVPTGPHDVPVHIVVTESRTIGP